jgi:hypothetical protein
MCKVDLHSLSAVSILWCTVGTSLFKELFVFNSLHITSKHLNVLVWSYCTVWQTDWWHIMRYCVWLQFCWQCHCCLLIIISVSCLLFIHMQRVWSTNTLVTYHKNHQRTRQPSASFAYYMLLPHISITLLSSGRYHLVYLFTYLFIYLALWDPEIHQGAHYTSMWHHPAALSTDSESSALNYWCPVGCLQACIMLHKLWWKEDVGVAQTTWQNMEWQTEWLGKSVKWLGTQGTN